MSLQRPGHGGVPGDRSNAMRRRRTAKDASLAAGCSPILRMTANEKAFRYVELPVLAGEPVASAATANAYLRPDAAGHDRRLSGSSVGSSVRLQLHFYWRVLR